MGLFGFSWPKNASGQKKKESGRFFEKNAPAGLVGQRRLRKKLLLLKTELLKPPMD
jgi:hypothetical protein